mmetsp:Transcript_5990/g.11995  ORF Transcript_5990/g.11995 Transcript_5990/m.11995 type:complete len:458 (-) Transcript_5990:55-1428(-)
MLEHVEFSAPGVSFTLFAAAGLVFWLSVHLVNSNGASLLSSRSLALLILTDKSPGTGHPLELAASASNAARLPQTSLGAAWASAAAATASAPSHRKVVTARSTTAAPSSAIDLCREIKAHYERVHGLFNASMGVHRGDPVALHKALAAKSSDAASPFNKSAKELNSLYPRTFKYAERFVYFQSLHQETASPPRVRLLIFTLSMSHELAYREVHRRTWMSRPGVCGVNASTLREPKDCRAFATFAVGRVGGDGLLDQLVAEEAAAFGDVSVVDAQDPPATGKNPYKIARQKEKDMAALLFSATHFPWTTHIGKNDLDNYPQVDLILKDLADPQGMRLGASRGVPPAGWRTDPPGPVFYGALMGGDPAQTVQRGGTGFMQGQFYAVSRSTLQCITGLLRPVPAEFAFPRKPIPPCVFQPEGDMVFGCLVKLYTNNGSCTVPWWISVREAAPQRWHLCKP